MKRKERIPLPKACLFCGKCFRDYRQVEQHMNKHTRERPYECSQCDANFCFPNALYVHENNIHRGIRHHCTVCRKSFTVLSNLIQHKRFHILDKEGVKKVKFQAKRKMASIIANNIVLERRPKTERNEGVGRRRRGAPLNAVTNPKSEEMIGVAGPNSRHHSKPVTAPKLETTVRKGGGCSKTVASTKGKSSISNLKPVRLPILRLTRSRLAEIKMRQREETVVESVSSATDNHNAPADPHPLMAASELEATNEEKVSKMKEESIQDTRCDVKVECSENTTDEGPSRGDDKEITSGDCSQANGEVEAMAMNMVDMSNVISEENGDNCYESTEAPTTPKPTPPTDCKVADEKEADDEPSQRCKEEAGPGHGSMAPVDSVLTARDGEQGKMKSPPPLSPTSPPKHQITFPDMVYLPLNDPRVLLMTKLNLPSAYTPGMCSLPPHPPNLFFSVHGQIEMPVLSLHHLRKLASPPTSSESEESENNEEFVGEEEEEDESMSKAVSTREKPTTTKIEVCDTQISSTPRPQKSGNDLAQQSTDPQRLDSGHSCPLCGKVFPYPSKLTTHMIVHSDEKPFVCKICSRSFLRQIGLWRHHTRMHKRKTPLATGKNKAARKT